MMELGEDLLDYAVIQLATDGTTVFSCAAGPAAAAQQVAAPRPQPQTLETE